MSIKTPDTAKPRITILISGRGSNMAALHRACCSGELDAEITHVISNTPDAAGLDYAAKNGIKTSTIDHRDYADRSDFDQALITAIEKNDPSDMILLAGFMRRLTGEFTRHFYGRLINIHPSLLPRHRGLNTHAGALAAKENWHGCSVHFVSEELDGGPVIARGIVPVLADDTETTLAARVLATEHRLYPTVVQLCLHGNAVCQDRHVIINNQPLCYPLLYRYG